MLDCTKSVREQSDAIRCDQTRSVRLGPLPACKPKLQQAGVYYIFTFHCSCMYEIFLKDPSQYESWHSSVIINLWQCWQFFTFRSGHPSNTHDKKSEQCFAKCSIHFFSNVLYESDPCNVLGLHQGKVFVFS